MSNHLVCLTFDFDAMSGFIARGLTSPTPISRGEFGAAAVPRILALLDKYSIQSTWFIPGIVITSYPQLCQQIAAAGHEIGHHGWTHETPISLSYEQEEDGLIRGNEAIAEITGRPASGYRSPAWDLSPNTIKLLIDHGFTYESSMMGHDYLPYQARIGDVVHADKAMAFGQETELIEMPISWSLDDYPHFEFIRTANSVLPGLMNANGVLSNWIDDFEYLRDHLDWGVITYTCHPLVIGRGHRMLMLERLIQNLRESEVRFVTMLNAAREYADKNSA